MSGIFVTENDTFDVIVRYVEKDGKIDILADDAKDTKDTKGSSSLKVTFKKPDFSTSQTILSNSTYHGNDGAVNIDMMALRTVMLSALIRSWDAMDEAGKPVPVTPETIGKMRVEIAKALTEKLVAIEGLNIV